MPPIPLLNRKFPPGAAFAEGNNAIITGGASGIGLAIAHLARKKGMKVGIIDRNVEQLDEAKQALAYGKPEDVQIFDADVSNSQDWEKLKGDVERNFGRIDLLVLNAGIGLKGTWGDTEYFQTVLGTNLFGVVHGLNAFVQKIRDQSTPSSIVITGSKQGITNPPGNAAYNASKAAVKSLAEQLNYDFRATAVTVHLLVPGWTFTGLTGAGSVKEKPDGAWTGEQVAEYMEKKIKEGQFYIICPDNETSEDTDKKRMMWSVGDIVYGRQPLSRWRNEYNEESGKWMEENSF